MLEVEPTEQHVGMTVRSDRNDTIRYDTRCYFNVRSKADISQLNLPHGNVLDAEKF